MLKGLNEANLPVKWTKDLVGVHCKKNSIYQFEMIAIV